MTLLAPTRKESVWLACKQKTCCYAAVIPSGEDVWRIARALETPPWTFLVYFQSPQPRRDAFFLDRSGRTFRIALARGKQGAGRAGSKTGGTATGGASPGRPKRPAPCIFLLQLRRGQHRCGLGDLRPAVCRSFPSELVEGVVCVRPDHGCVCREWSLADVDIEQEMEILGERQEDAEVYCQVVANWNARVMTSPEDDVFDFTEFCAYLVSAYDSIHAEPVA